MDLIHTSPKEHETHLCPSPAEGLNPANTTPVMSLLKALRPPSSRQPASIKLVPEPGAPTPPAHLSLSSPSCHLHQAPRRKAGPVPCGLAGGRADGDSLVEEVEADAVVPLADDIIAEGR